MAAAQQSQQSDNSLTPFWIVIGIFALGWIIWTVAHTQIAAAVYQLRLWEAELIHFFIGSSSTADLIATIQQASTQQVQFVDLVDISDQVGKYLSYPIAALLIILSSLLYFGHANARFKKTYNMQLLVQTEKEDWPQITPVAHLDLIHVDIHQGPWSAALSPMQFAKKYNLLSLQEIVTSDQTQKVTKKIIYTIQREETNKVLALQLGDYWNGTDRLPAHTKALFAAFAAQACRNHSASRKLLAQIANSSISSRLDFSGTEELIKKYQEFKSIKKVIRKHAYVLTVMASMLVLARQEGVLASADFLWLKPIDRLLWFTLNSIGRQTAFSEAAGPFSHWIAERVIGRRLIVPMIDEGVNALDRALEEVLYVPEESEDD